MTRKRIMMLHLEGLLNLFFKAILILLTLMAFPLHALEIQAVYTSNCKREIGLILDVGKRHIGILNLEGEYVVIERYNVVYLASYPSDRLPLIRKSDQIPLPYFKIKARNSNQIIPLVEGWPIGFTKEKISFLSQNGRELVIDRKRIWELEKEDSQNRVNVQKKAKESLEFTHPYAYQSCPQKLYPLKLSKNIKIYPQQVLSDPITIKRELDEFFTYYKGVNRYNREQQFYPVPEIYKNNTQLGMWLSLGSRYGGSNRRPNNLTPYLIDEYSSDVFDYQSRFTTGNGPMSFSVHEEVQTHIYYGFKASYFHFNIMVDPNLVLVGERYEWQNSDFDNETDDRLNDSAQAEMGFDYGPFSLDLGVFHGVSYGLFYNNDLITGNVALSRFGLTYRNTFFKSQFFFATGSDDEFEQSYSLDVFRLNLESDFLQEWKFQYSLISREVKYDVNNQVFNYNSTSLTNAIYGFYVFKKRYNLGAFVSLELHEREFINANNLATNDSQTFFKSGVFVSLSF